MGLTGPDVSHTGPDVSGPGPDVGLCVTSSSDLQQNICLQIKKHLAVNFGACEDELNLSFRLSD